MKPKYITLAGVVLAGITMIATGSCRGTMNGVVDDTKRNTKAVGKGVVHVGHKIGEGVKHTGEKIKGSTR